MSKTNISRFDGTDYLGSEEMIAAYLNAAIEENDPELLLAAIADVAKARGITKVAQDAGVGRESLYKTLSPGSRPRSGWSRRRGTPRGLPPAHLRRNPARQSQRE